MLPLDASKLSSIAMIGPHANASQDMLSNYHGTNTLVNSHTPLLAMQKQLPAADVLFEQGCTVGCQETSGFARAVDAAGSADAVVVFLGIDQTEEQEGQDRTSIDLPGHQLELLQQVAQAAGAKPLVVVYIHGGVLGDAWVKANVPAIVDAHYPGELGGDAIAEVLLGQTNPSGRVTTTWYASDITSKRSMFDMSIKPHDDVPGLTYMFYGPGDGAMWEFGDGLSYTTFDVQWASGVGATRTMAVAGTDVASGAQEMSYTVTVTNTGSVAGAWSVLGFVTPTGGEGLRVSGARKELFDFDRTVVLAPGKSQVLHLTIPASVLASADEDGELVVREGSYEVQIEGLRAEIEVGRGTGATVFSIAEARRRYEAGL